MKCPRCGGVLVGQTLGASPPPDAGPYRSLPDTAPIRDTRRIVVDRCTSCKGLWFDRGEMQAAIHEAKIQSSSRFPAATPQREQLGPCGPCPRCGATMEVIESQAAPEVEYDRCSSCDGIWFDAGEAEQFAGDVGLFALMLHEFDRS